MLVGYDCAAVDPRIGGDAAREVRSMERALGRMPLERPLGLRAREDS